jgi:hypothetical protein
MNLQAKNDPEAQKLLDQALADLQALQQDEAVRNAAFGQFVQAERSGDAEAIQKAHKEVNAASAKLLADSRKFNQQDLVALRKRIREVVSHPGSVPATGNPPAATASPSAPVPASASTN